MERLEDLVQKTIKAKTKAIIHVAKMPVLAVFRRDKIWEGSVWIMEASSVPVSIPGGGDQATGNMTRTIRESVMIAKTFSQKFLQKIDPGNQFFQDNW